MSKLILCFVHRKSVLCSNNLMLFLLIICSNLSLSGSQEKDPEFMDTSVRFIRDFSEFLNFHQCLILFPSERESSCKLMQFKLMKEAQISGDCVVNYTALRRRNWQNQILYPTILNLFDVDLSATDFTTWNQNLMSHYKKQKHIIAITDSVTNAEFVLANLKPENAINYRFIMVRPSVEESSSNELIVEHVYGFVTTTQLVRNQFGQWSVNGGLRINWNKYSSISDFGGIPIRITTLAGNPVVYVDQTDDGIQGRGFLPDIVLDTLQLRLNFTYVLSTPVDHAFGSADESGNWSGMVGELQRKEVDVAMMSFSLTTGRRAVMDFSPAVEYSSTRLILRKDQQAPEFKWNAYSSPFEKRVWVLIPCTIFLGSIVMTILIHCKNLFVSILQNIWLLSVCFVQQGLDDHSAIRRFPCRIALISFWILAVILYASYTARLTAFLAAVTNTIPIKSLAEALGSSSWKIGMVGGSSVPDRVKTSRMPEMEAMWRQVSKDPSVFVPNFVEGINRAYSERFIFFTSDLIPSFVVKDNCSFAWVPGRYFSGFGYMGYQSDLPFADSLSNQVSKVRETGQMKRLLRKWWGSGSGCSGESSTGEYPGMSLYETGTAFILLSMGSALAFSILTVELALLYRKSWKRLPVKLDEGKNSKRILMSVANADIFATRNSSGEYLRWPADQNVLTPSYQKDLSIRIS